MAAAVHADVEPPFAFFGHSMGALVAFEVARALGSDGPAALYVAGCRPPDEVREDGAATLSDGGLLDRLARFSGTPPMLLEEPELMRRALPVVRADFEALADYAFTPGPRIAAPVVAFAGFDDLESPPAAMGGWGPAHRSCLRGDRRTGRPLLLPCAQERRRRAAASRPPIPLPGRVSETTDERALPALEHLLPTNDDVTFFREHGWYVTPKIFGDEAIERARGGAERHYAGERDRELPIDLDPRLDWRPGCSMQLRLNDYVTLVNADFRTLLESSVLAATAARLAGTPRVRLFNGALVTKPPRTSTAEVGIGWHTDRAYWQMCTSEQMLTAWIPLQPCDAQMGTLTVLDGSNRWPATPEVQAVRLGNSFVGADPAEVESRLAATAMPLDPVAIALEQGQVSFHHCLTLHSSGANRSDRPRVAAVVALQDEANRYRRAIRPEGDVATHGNDRLCRRLPNGDPDYADPGICPVLPLAPPT